MRQVLVGIGAVAISVGLAHGAVAKEMTLRAGFFIPAAKEPFKIAFMNWVDTINRDGKGLVRISQVVGPAAVPGGQWCNFVKAGTLQLVGIPPSYCANLVPGLEALDAANVPPAEQRRNGVYDFVRKLTAERANAYMVGQYGFGVKYNIYTKKKIATLADFRGLRFRTNPAYTPLYTALGIAGVQMPNGEIYTAMERGVIDGYALPPTLILPFGLNKVTKYRFEPGFYNPTVIALVNLRTWNAMSPEQKAFMEKKGIELETTVNTALVSTVDATLARMEKAGVEPINPPEAMRKEFLKIAYDAMWKNLLEKSPETGARFRQLLEQ